VKLRPDSTTGADESHPDIESEETTLADGEWPVAEHYRIDPSSIQRESNPEAASDDGQDTVDRTIAAPGPRRRFPRPSGIAVGLGLLLLAALLLVSAGGLWLLARDGRDVGEAASPTSTAPSSTPTARPTPTAASEAREVPTVVGLDLADARERLTEADLRSSVRRVDSTKPRDEVLRQSPEEGAAPPDDRVVALTVSSGSTPQAATIAV
jgi:PASTA domain